MCYTVRGTSFLSPGRLVLDSEIRGLQGPVGLTSFYGISIEGVPVLVQYVNSTQVAAEEKKRKGIWHLPPYWRLEFLVGE